MDYGEDPNEWISELIRMRLNLKNLFKEEMNVLKDEVKLIAGINRDMKIDMKQDVRRIEKIVEDTEQRVKEDSREFSRDMRDLRKELEEKIKKALSNPLAGMRK